MQGTMIIIPPVGPEVRVALKAEPEVEAMQRAVGGWLEAVPGFTTLETAEGVVPCVALCNEEGKLSRPEPLFDNPRANLLWEAAMRRAYSVGIEPDHLVGTVVILTGDDEFMRAL